MNKIISISIAAYNVEKSINETLDSFVIPEIMNDIEVIIVNDGSTDNTSQIAHNFSKKYPDTFIVIDKINGGYGSTINVASQEAHGKYFKTVDGDDWVERKGFIELVNYLKKISDDVVVTNYWRVNDKTKKKIPTIFKCSEYKKTYSFEEAYDNQKLFMQALAIKTSILKNIKIDITEHCFYTDIEYILTVVPYLKTISFLDTYVYMYRVAVNEQSMSVAGKRKHIDEQLKVYRKMTSYYNMVRNDLDDGKCKFFLTILSEMYKSHITAILSLKISIQSKQRMLDIEHYTRDMVREVFDETNKYKTIRILRSTDYMAYALGSVAYKIYQKFLAISGR